METVDLSVVLINIDQPHAFARLKARLVSQDGLSYRDFKGSLVPNYRRAKRDLALAIGYLIATLLVLCVASKIVAPVLLLVPGAIALGFLIAHHQLFLHAAAHYELDRDRTVNDRISNSFVGIISGQEIAAYRVNHFLHHNLHGTTADAENSYFNALTFGFLMRLLTGIHVARIILQRRRLAGPRIESGDGKPKPSLQLVYSVTFQLILLLILGVYSPFVAAAWLLGLIIFFPFFAALRQVLEHRDLRALDDLDYRTVPHGPVNRMFKDSLFSRLFGGAGFSRHALHHWESGISYTNLAEFEQFLSSTILADSVRAGTTTYRETFCKLFRMKM